MDHLLCVSHLLFFNPMGLISVAVIYTGWDNAAAPCLGAWSPKQCWVPKPPRAGCRRLPRLSAGAHSSSHVVPGMSTAAWTNTEPVPPLCHLLRGPHSWAWSLLVLFLQHFPLEIEGETLEMVVGWAGGAAGSYGEGDIFVWGVLGAEHPIGHLFPTALGSPSPKPAASEPARQKPGCFGVVRAT